VRYGLSGRSGKGKQKNIVLSRYDISSYNTGLLNGFNERMSGYKIWFEEYDNGELPKDVLTNFRIGDGMYDAQTTVSNRFYKSIMQSVMNITTMMLFYATLFGAVISVYNNNQIENNIVNKSFEDIKANRMSVDNNINSINALNSSCEDIVIKDYESFVKTYKKNKKLRKGFQYSLCDRISMNFRLCCRKKQKKEIIFENSMKTFSKKMSIENIFKLSIKFDILKDHLLKGRTLALFNNIGKYQVSCKETKRDSLLNNDSNNKLRLFYDYITSDLDKQDLYQYLDEDLKDIYITFNK
jgi:hypothetical protein